MVVEVVVVEVEVVVVPTGEVPPTVVVGIVGAIVGGLLARYLGVTTATTSHSIVVEVIIAFVGAVILLAILRVAGVGKRRHRLFR